MEDFEEGKAWLPEAHVEVLLGLGIGQGFLLVFVFLCKTALAVMELASQEDSCLPRELQQTHMGTDTAATKLHCSNGEHLGRSLKKFPRSNWMSHSF